MHTHTTSSGVHTPVCVHTHCSLLCTHRHACIHKHTTSSCVHKHTRAHHTLLPPVCTHAHMYVYICTIHAHPAPSCVYTYTCMHTHICIQMHTHCAPSCMCAHHLHPGFKPRCLGEQAGLYMHRREVPWARGSDKRASARVRATVTSSTWCCHMQPRRPASHFFKRSPKSRYLYDVSWFLIATMQVRKLQLVCVGHGHPCAVRSSVKTDPHTSLAAQHFSMRVASGLSSAA